MPLRLTSVELSDVGRFGRKFIDLAGDAVCLVGGNGAGKTTTVAAIYYALTGDLGRLGKRDGAVALDRAYPDAQPYVRLTLSPSGDPGDVAVVTRWLPDGTSRGRRRLVHADRVYTAESDVDRVVGRWVGLPAAAVADFVFVPQGRLTAVLEDPPAKRAEVLHRLFAVSPAEAAREAISLAVKALPARPDPTVAAAARARQAELEAYSADVDKRLSELPNYPPDVVAAAKAVATAAARREAMLPFLTAARARLAQAERDAAAPDASITGPNPDQLAARRAEWAAYREAVAARDNQLAEAEGWRAELASLPDPPDPGPPPPAVDAERLALYDAVAACTPGETCPVCRQPVAGGLDVAAAAADAAAVREQQTRYRQAHAAWTEAAALRRKVETRRANLLSRIESAEAYAGDEPVPPADPEPTPDEVAAARAAWRAASAQAVRTAEAVRNLPEYRREVRETLAALPAEVGPDDARQADELVNAAAAAADARARLSGEAAAARRAAAANASIVAAAAAAEESYRGVDDWREVLEGAAAVLHRDAAPAAVVRARLAAMTSAINATAASLGADFEVAVGADGDLTATRGGRPVPRLSGGQAAVLALAWRMALSPGLLCLDEPTYGLDDRRLGLLRDAIAAWRASRTGGQLVVVTHERRLVGAFDRVIEL